MPSAIHPALGLIVIRNLDEGVAIPCQTEPIGPIRGSSSQPCLSQFLHRSTSAILRGNVRGAGRHSPNMFKQYRGRLGERSTDTAEKNRLNSRVGDGTMDHEVITQTSCTDETAHEYLLTCRQLSVRVSSTSRDRVATLLPLG